MSIEPDGDSLTTIRWWLRNIPRRDQGWQRKSGLDVSGRPPERPTFEVSFRGSKPVSVGVWTTPERSQYLAVRTIWPLREHVGEGIWGLLPFGRISPCENVIVIAAAKSQTTNNMEYRRLFEVAILLPARMAMAVGTARGIPSRRKRESARVLGSRPSALLAT